MPSEAEAMSLLQQTQASLAESSLCLHKFVSNSPEVIVAFSEEDCVPVNKDLDLSGYVATMQHSLGLPCEIKSDTFTFSVSIDVKPLTWHEVLSAVNRVFDPLGLLVPVMVQGRVLLRELTSELSDWDLPLPEDKLKKWETWRYSFQILKGLHVPCTYTQSSLCKIAHKELCVFSDESIKAIGTVAYLRVVRKDGKIEVGFIMGKAKLTPQSRPTIPRLELYAAVLATEMADLIQEVLDLKLDTIRFFPKARWSMGTSIMRLSISACMSTTEFNIPNNPPNQNNGIMCLWKRTL